MLKKLKKGFTLAELLIVVAIVAVLTAIAVPLFVGAVNDAKTARDDANIRALKVEAAIYILSKADAPAAADETPVWPSEKTGKIQGWNINGEVHADGSITVTKVECVQEGGSLNPSSAPTVIWTESVCTITGIWLPRSEVNL